MIYEILTKRNAKINNNNTSGKFDIINENLNTLGWVVLKSSMVMGDKYDESLARLNIIESEINIGRNLLILIMKEIFYFQVIMVIRD